MKRLPIKVIVISLMVLVIIGSGIFAFLFFRNKTAELPEYPKVKDGEYIFVSFPQTQEAYFSAGKKREWKSRIFQGLIKGYGEKDGISYATIEYQTDDKDFVELNVLLQVRKDMLPSEVLKTEKDKGDDTLYSLFSEKFTDFIALRTTRDVLSTDEHATIYIKYEDFKEAYPVDTALAFRAFITYPEKVDRTEKYCLENDIVNCLWGDMTDIYTTRQGVNDFWKKQRLDENKFIVPLDIYSDLIIVDLPSEK